MAAEIGTRKGNPDHSTIGLVVTTDGSFGELERQAYIKPEETAVRELQEIGKPFLVLLNPAARIPRRPEIWQGNWRQSTVSVLCR